MRSDKTLTISIAAYNMRDYLPRCLDSLIAPEIMDDIEALIINDGSSDDTLEIARRYEANYPGTFKAIDKPNGGHGSTINKGIALARGKYFKLLDADDWFDTGALTRLVAALKSLDSDVVVCNYSLEFVSRHKTKPMIFKSVAYNQTYDYQNWRGIFDLERPWLELPAITYKTSILRQNHITVSECFYCDIEYCCYPLKYVRAITFLDLRVYRYFIGRSGQSVSREGATKHYADHLRICKNMTAYYLENKDTPSPVLRRICLEVALLKIRQNYTVLLKHYLDRKTAACLLDEFDAWLHHQSADLYKESARMTIKGVVKPIALWRKYRFNVYQTRLYAALEKIYRRLGK